MELFKYIPLFTIKKSNGFSFREYGCLDVAVEKTSMLHTKHWIPDGNVIMKISAHCTVLHRGTKGVFWKLVFAISNWIWNLHAVCVRSTFFWGDLWLQFCTFLDKKEQILQGFFSKKHQNSSFSNCYLCF